MTALAHLAAWLAFWLVAIPAWLLWERKRHLAAQAQRHDELSAQLHTFIRGNTMEVTDDLPAPRRKPVDPAA